MPSVMFDVGSSFARKRKRMKGTNAKKVVEVKQWNPRYTGDSDSFDSVNIYNLCSNTLISPAGASSWMPFKINWPLTGTNSYNRIGNSIFLKYLRFKGYVRVYNRAVHGIRWRLRLIRADGFKFLEPSGQGIQLLKQYLNMWKAGQYPSQDSEFSVANSVAGMTRHNFYKAFKDVQYNNILQTKVIASGYVPVSSPATNSVTTGTIAGSETSTVALNTNLIVSNLSEGYYNVPIDVKVKCNDNVKVDDITYYYVLETDFGVGISYSNTNGLSLSMAISSVIFELNFFIRGYFTDQ